MSETGHPTLARIDSIKKKYLENFEDRDKAVVQAWEKTVRDLMVREKLSENPALVEIIRALIGNVKEMNELLLSADSTSLPDKDRNRILDKKRLYVDFIRLFDSTVIRTELASVEKSIDELAPAV